MGIIITQASIGKFKEINGLTSIPEIEEVLAVAGGVKLAFNQEAELTAAADKIAEVTQKIGESYDGSQWVGVDKMIPTKYQGNPGEPPPGK